MNTQKTKERMELERRYKDLVDKYTPKSEMTRSMTKAFIIGGLICVVGQIILELAKHIQGFDEASASTFTSLAMIFLGAFITGIGKYDTLGKHAGAGSIVPITGFANSIVAAAMEFRREGFVMGVGARMFQVAGPVLVYGISASVIAGLIYFFIR